MDNEIAKADAKLFDKKQQVANELSKKDERINSEEKVLNDLSISLKQAEEHSNNLKRNLKIKRISIETMKISNNELEAKMKVAEEDLI